jgi:hypothetical protein
VKRADYEMTYGVSLAMGNENSNKKKRKEAGKGMRDGDIYKED